MSTVALLLLLCVAAAPAAGLGQTPRRHPAALNYLPTLELQSMSMEELDSLLNVMTDLLTEHTMEDGTRRLVSRMSAPTLGAGSELCNQHTQIYWNSLLSKTPALWALKMFDSSGKLPDGILTGNVQAFGSWDECLNTEVKLNGSDYPSLSGDQLVFRGRYAPVVVSPVRHYSSGGPQQADGLGEVVILPLAGARSGTVGMCVPSSCSSDDVKSGIEKLLGSNFTVTAGPTKTKTETADLMWSDIFVIVIMSLVGVLMVLGTAVDLYHRHCNKILAGELHMTSVVHSVNKRLPGMMYISEAEPKELQQRKLPSLISSQQALVAFSPYTNLKKLLDTSPRTGAIDCLHGIRFISMTWVVMGHSATNVMRYDQNPVVAMDWIRQPLFQVIINATPSVDTFFLLSGLLLSYGFCAVYKKTKHFDLPMFYVHRFVRLTPPLAMMVGITATWFVYIGDGPLWAMNAPQMKESCVKYGWREIIYIVNFFDWGDMCIPQSWYLAADMQMYVFAPLVLLPLVWRPKLGALWLGLLTTIFLAIRIVIWDVKDLPPTLLPANPGPDPATFNLNYGYAWNRCTVWLLGIGLGCVLHRLRGRKLALPPWLVLPAWVAAFAVGVAVIYGLVDYQMPWQPVGKTVAVVYGGLHRFAWGVAVSWVIFACATGNGGWVNTLLSYRAFIPLSRLTYCCYLVHVMVLFFVDYSVKGTLYVDVIRLIYRLLAHMITSFAFALPLSLAFEAPFISLEKLIFSPEKPRIII